MALPTSVLGMSAIQTEFGGSNPIGLSEYYGVNANVASSGTIRMASFLGLSVGPPVRIDAVGTYAYDIALAEARHTFAANGSFISAVNQQDAGGWAGSALYSWLGSGQSASSFQLRIVLNGSNGGTSFSAGLANNTWVSMTTDRYVNVLSDNDGVYEQQYTASIRWASNSTIITSNTCYLYAQDKK